MDIEQIRQLVTVAECGTMSEAASRLALSQPALSRSIQRLEAELGAPLFNRGKNRVALNTAGRAAVEQGHVVLREAQRLFDVVDEAARRSRALRVGTCAPAPLWNLTARIIERFPGDVLESETLDEREIEQRVLNGSIDFGISRKPFLLPVVTNTLLMTETLSIAVPPDHPLARRSSVHFSDIDGVDFLLLEDIGVWHDFHRRYMPHSHFFLQKDREVYLQTAAASPLPIFVTDIPVMRYAFPERVRVPIDEPEATASFYLLAREDASPRVREIVDWVARS
ncbi:LysR family transcriptional regulator [Adlercreutzia sp. R25]|uniref:LysR family transcriptional regulator n=1 Tax=Adlercreutzia shanghongiae TaxID=3111773 RepID=UPI002DB74575|nr:LysR family transcriptional regulator [Adlercreutzia sp. R25]MEC4271918.1 LysR family transcriptional regulator [Adlercreutzia sp. R25]